MVFQKALTAHGSCISCRPWTTLHSRLRCSPLAALRVAPGELRSRRSL